MTVENTLQPEWTQGVPANRGAAGTRREGAQPSHAHAPAQASPRDAGRPSTARRLQSLVLYQKPVLPGFGLSLGVSVLFISLVILFPLSALFVFISDMGMAQFWSAVSDPRVVAAYRVTLSAAFWSTAAALVIGTLLAWVLARYDFPGRRDRKSTRLNSSHVAISYAVFCLKKKTDNTNRHNGPMNRQNAC